MEQGSEGVVRPRWLFGPFTATATDTATFVELFFDLVFVFAVTEVTAMTLEHLDWEGAARSALIFWMIWWAWTQWTWALNPADANHVVLRVGTLVATSIAFLMAASVGDAFGEDGGLWFAVPYVLVRVVGLGLYSLVASEHQEQLAAVRRFGLASVPGLVVVVVGGFMDADVRGWWWLGAVVLDVSAALVAGRDEGWGLRAAHFAERHGLFVIIALGESLIVVGLTVAEAERTGDLLAVAIGAVSVGCLLWWTYFGWLKDDLEGLLEREPAATEGALARDMYSLLHFPLIGGVIGVAVGFEEMALHPDEHLPTEAMVALGIGVALFVLGGAASWARGSGRALLPRAGIVAALIVALVVVAEERPAVVLATIAAALVAIAAVELWRDPAVAGEHGGGVPAVATGADGA